MRPPCPDTAVIHETRFKKRRSDADRVGVQIGDEAAEAGPVSWSRSRAGRDSIGTLSERHGLKM
jgi:hypothetical protein